MCIYDQTRVVILQVANQTLFAGIVCLGTPAITAPIQTFNARFNFGLSQSTNPPSPIILCERMKDNVPISPNLQPFVHHK